MHHGIFCWRCVLLYVLNHVNKPFPGLMKTLFFQGSDEKQNLNHNLASRNDKSSHEGSR